MAPRAKRWILKRVLCVDRALRNAWLSRILEQSAPFVAAFFATRRLRRRIKRAKASGGFRTKAELLARVGLERIESAHELEITRRAHLQQRSQTNLQLTALIVWLSFGAIGLMNGDEPLLDGGAAVVTATLSCIAIIYLIASALCAARAIGVGRVHDRYLQVLEQFHGDQIDRSGEREYLAMCVLLNQGEILEVTNYADASFKSLRNGIATLGFVLGLILVISVL